MYRACAQCHTHKHVTGLGRLGRSEVRNIRQRQQMSTKRRDMRLETTILCTILPISCGILLRRWS